MELKKIRGTVSSVMESWPLELQIRMNDGANANVILDDACEISIQGVSCRTDRITPGIRVEISAHPNAPSLALKLEIL